MAIATHMMDRVDRLSDLRRTVEQMKARGLIRPAGSGPVLVNGKERSGVVTQVVKVTPDLAREWLGRNAKNRRLRESAVEAFARDMRAGEWLLTHQGVAFSAAGMLLDGQHRLAAVERAGVEVEMMVTTGLPEKVKGKVLTTMGAVDRGAVRSVADQLSIEHGVERSALASAAALVIAQVCVRPVKLKRVTVSQVLRILSVYGDGIGWVVERVSRLKQLRPAPVLGAVAFVWSNPKDRKMTEEFYHSFVTGESLGAGSPVLMLRNWLCTQEALRGSHDQRAKVTDRVLQALHQFIYAEGSRVTAAGAFEAFAADQMESVERVRKIFK